MREKYPLDRAHSEAMPSADKIHEHLQKAKEGESLKKVLNPLLEFGSAVIDHVLLKAGFAIGCKIGKDFNITEDMSKLILALEDANNIVDHAKKNTSKGYIIQKKRNKTNSKRRGGLYIR